MPISTLIKQVIAAPWGDSNLTKWKTWVDAITTAANAGTLAGGALSADTAGRAVMASGYFNEATATAKFASQAITGALIKNLGVDTAQLAAVSVTEPKVAPSILTAKHAAVAAAGNTVGALDQLIIMASADGNTVLDGVTLDATYGKIEIDDVFFKKGPTTGGATDAVQLCTDSGGTTAITSSLALNTITEGSIVRTTSILNGGLAAGAHIYVKRTKTTNNAGTFYIRCHRVA